MEHGNAIDKPVATVLFHSAVVERYLEVAFALILLMLSGFVCSSPSVVVELTIHREK